MDIFVEQFPFLGTKIVQKHRRNTEGRTISMPMYIYIFPTEKKWHRISFILYLICLVHFSTNTHPHAHTQLHTLSCTLSPAQESRKHSEDDDRNNVTEQVLHCGVQTEP